MATAPDAAAPVRVPLMRGAVALIDAADTDAILAYDWYLHSKGYAARKRRIEDPPGRGAILMHRAILDAPAGMTVRHRPGVPRLDIRRPGLQLVTISQERAGHDRRHDNASGYRGVSWTKVRRCWQALIQVNGRRRYLGCFTDSAEAARAYDAAAEEAFGDVAQLNTPRRTVDASPQ
jgi:hypothetical protein